MSSSKRLETIDEIVEKYCVSSSPLKSKIFVSVGYIFVLFAIFTSGPTIEYGPISTLSAIFDFSDIIAVLCITNYN